MHIYHSKKVLITVKTYPTPSRKGVEVSCTAGITDNGEWIRIFPVPFRFLAGDKQFKKYQWIEVAVCKASDPRPDSYRVDSDSIKILSPPLPTAQYWQARSEIISPLVSSSLCQLERNRREGGPTLGIFKPYQIKGLSITKETKPDWTEKERGILSQQSMYDTRKFNVLEKIPYKFTYSFTCNDPNCNGHQLSVIDWEIGQSYRSWSKTYGDDWKKAFRNKYETEMILNRDTHFYMGTIRSHPHIWVIIGLYYPPKLS